MNRCAIMRGQRVSARAVVLVCVALLALAGTARPVRGVDFTFYFDDEPGTGFFDPVLGTSRREAIHAAGDIWGRLIRPAYTGETITVRAKFDEYEPGSTTLASAKANYFYSDFGSSSPQYFAETNYPKPLANHLAQRDLAPVRHEINITFNIARDFYYGTDGNPGGGQIDFVTVAAHEIGHGMGCDASCREDGGYGIYGDGTWDIFGGLPMPYDHFLKVGTFGQPLLSLSSSAREMALVSDNLFWSGANGVAANGGTPPKIFAPSPFIVGSSISHVDPVFASLMVPSYPGVVHTLSAVERGMLRDMGWNISIAPRQITWIGAGADNRASTPGNFSPDLPLPEDNIVFSIFGSSSDVRMDLVLYSLGSIRFAGDSPARTLQFSPWTDTDLIGEGLVNESGQAQTIVLEARPGPISSGTDPTIQTSAAVMALRGAASAGNARYELAGGGTGYHTMPNVPPSFQWSEGARLTFHGSATAEDATFVVGGGAGALAPGALVRFRDSATAGSAFFHNQAGKVGVNLPLGTLASGLGGETRFENEAGAGTAWFINEGESEYRGGSGGVTRFRDTATADQGQFENHGATSISGRGGATLFHGSSTAAAGRFTNLGSGVLDGMGQTVFFDNATAGAAELTNVAGAGSHHFGGVTRFRGSSNADSATIINRGATGGSHPGITQFHDDASAGSATIRHEPNDPGGGWGGGRTEFYGRSSAAGAIFTVEGAGSALAGGVYFRDDSSAGQGQFTIEPFTNNGLIYFDHQASAGQGVFVLEERSGGRVQFFGSSTAANGTFTIGADSQVQFYSTSTAADATITIRPRGVGQFSGQFNTPQAPTATAASATIRVMGGMVSNPSGGQNWGGALYFSTWSTAGAATIIAEGGTVTGAAGGTVSFGSDRSHAGNATIIAAGGVPGAAGGQVAFSLGAKGDSARLVAEAGGVFNFGQNRTYGGTEAGSIEGAGTFILGGSLLTTGNRNTSTTVDGQIIDGPSSVGSGGMLTKVGAGTLTLAGTNAYTGLTTVAGGTLRVNGSIPGDATVAPGATLGGTGTIGGAVTVAPGGIFSPGASAGTITVGALDLSETSLVLMELGTAASDRIIVNGHFAAAGTLAVSLLDGFLPLPGQQFDLITFGSRSGDFSTISLAGAGGGAGAGGMWLEAHFSDTSLLLTAAALAGDANRDGRVDGEDFLLWQAGFGTASGATWSSGDFNGDGRVDGEDFLIWQAHFGSVAGSSAVTPEPGSLGLLCLAAALIGRRIRRRP